MEQSPTTVPLRLCIDTAENVLVVALARGETVLAEQTIFSERSHARLVTVVVKELLHHLERTPNDLEQIAVVIGPGSYTGIRIGLSAAKGLAMALGISVVGIPTTALLAAGAQRLPSLRAHTYWMGMLHARKREAYVGVYDQSLQAMVAPAPMAVDSPAFKRLLDRYQPAILGSGAALLQGAVEPPLPCVPELPHRAQALAFAAECCFRLQGETQARDLSPLYLKPVRINRPKKLL